MPPRKRAAEDDGAGPTTRSAKAPKTDQSPAKARGGRTKKGPKANLAASAFKARALPLHVNITHTPPVLADDGTVSLASTDPGFVGTTTLLPGTFATGSYGWKGSKRLTIEIQNPDGGEGAEKEKVHVMLTINATVMGSKGAKDDEGEEGDPKEEGAEEAGDADAEKAVEEAVTEEEGKEAEGDAKEANGEAKEAMEDVKEGE
ncbi:hypothetical protein BV20DRAFT_1111564 [Pilatotrama ljubarskyi]|nr:hypothetical protein BV20DRAFT_1111564 [Pilatotrama ljubarskyi]